MTFQLDTSGAVKRAGGTMYDMDSGYYCWSDLSPFTQGYVEALFADLAKNSATGRFACLPHPSGEGTVIDLGFSDLALETLARIIADCGAMRGRLGDRFADGLADPTEEGAGRAFWKLRQKSLYAEFPPLTVQLGDDGKVRFA